MSETIGDATLFRGDCLDVMAGMIARGEVFDSIVTDPPYGIDFMGKGWDSADTVAFRAATWRLAFSLLKPGGYVLAFGGTRTFHRMAVAIEDAGFEIRDTCMWMYGTGFPKSLNVGKAIDKAAGAEREVISQGAAVKRMIPGADQNGTGSWVKDNGREYVPTETAPATPEAVEWDGWGTALKPAWEPIIMGRKPLIGTVAENVLTYGTGALNIDASRVPVADAAYARNCSGDRGHADNRAREMAFGMGCGHANDGGRWPANVLHDGSEEVLEAFAAYGERTSGAPGIKRNGNNGAAFGAESRPPGTQMSGFGDTGSAARFFYSAKATAADRAGSKHPTVKPLALMRYLCRMVTRPGGRILDPFAGSGTTLQAGIEAGFHAIGIEREPEYQADILRRLRGGRSPAFASPSATPGGPSPPSEPAKGQQDLFA